MRIAILGAGEVGMHLARVLAKDGHDVVLIESSSETARKARDDLDVEVVEGHGASVEVLERAGVQRANLVCAVTNNDELNMLASLIAKKLGAEQTAVRVHGLSHITRKRFFYRKTLDFDLTISPEEMSAAAISRFIRGQDSVSVESVADGKLQLHRFELTGRFDAVGKKIKDVRLPKQCLITALFRGDTILIPTGEDEIREGDQVLIIGASDVLERVDKILGARMRLPKRVMIMGGGRMGVAAARAFERLRIKVKLLEIDRDRAEGLPKLLPHSRIENADGTCPQHLLESHIEKTDLFLAMTRDDESNLIACQIARQHGAQQTISLVSRDDYQGLSQSLNIDSVISPRILIAERIVRFVRSGCRSRITSIESGEAEILELDVADESALAGRKVMNLGFPRGVLIGAVVRGEEILVPGGTDEIHGGDVLIVFALKECAHEVEGLFS